MIKETKERTSEVNRGDIEDEEGIEREIDPNQERDEAEYGDSDLEGEADEAPAPEEQPEDENEEGRPEERQEANNDEGFASGNDDEDGNITLGMISI